MGLQFHGSFGFPCTKRKIEVDNSPEEEFKESHLGIDLAPNKRRKLSEKLGEGVSFGFSGTAQLLFELPVPIDGVPEPNNTGNGLEDTEKEAISDLLMDDPIFLAEKEHIETLLQYTFKDPTLLREAMYPLKKHPARLPGGQLLDEANFKLAQVGDTILRSTLLDYWHEQQSGTIGSRENRLQGLVTDANLVLVAEMHGIATLLRKWYPADTRQGPGKKCIATTVEAIIGAVW